MAHSQLLPGLTLCIVTLSCFIFSVSSHNFLKDSEASLGLGFDILPPRETYTTEGARLLIPCRPVSTDKGEVNVTWTNEGRVVNDDRRYVLPNGTLLITKVTSDDASQYRCVLQLDNYTVLSAPLNVVMADTGSWQMLPKKANKRVGSAVRLSCHLPSLPAATLTWYKGSEPLSLANPRYYQPTPGVLQITNLTQQDSGIYKCKGVNPIIDKEFMSPDGQLTVESAAHEDPSDGGEGSTGGGSSAPSRPTLLAVPSKVEVVEGQRAVLECITDDDTKPELLWSRIDGKEIRREGVHTEGQGSLVFDSVIEYDASVYNCSVVSPLLRSPVTQMTELSVLVPPKLTIKITPQGGRVLNGESVVRINCSATGLPAPEIYWHKDGFAVPFSGRHIFDTLESERNTTMQQLAITNIMSTDSGVFQCIAKNRAGVASEGALLMVKLSPNMPGVAQNVNVIERTSNSVLVAWNPPPPVQNAEVQTQGYVIHYLEIAGSDQEKQKLSNNTSYRITELRPYTLYSFYVRTFAILRGHRNPFFGEPSQKLIVRTKPGVPTKVPTVVMTAVSPTVLRLRWNPLTQEEARGQVVQQKVHWRKKDSQESFYEDLSDKVNTFDIKDLHPNKWYEVRVLAKTAAGYPDSELLKASWLKIKMPKKGSQDEKPIVHLTVNSDHPTQIVVDWELSEELRAEVVSYGISFNSSRGTESHRTLSAAATSILLDDLDPATCYSVQVEPIYKKGKKKAVVQTICTLDETSPPLVPPTDEDTKIGVKKVKVKTLNTTSIQVTWRPKGRKVVPEFFTIKVVNLGRQKLSSVAAPIYVDNEPRDLDLTRIEHNRPSHPTPLERTESPKESQVIRNFDQDDPEAEDHVVRYWRVTGRKVILTDLKPLNKYEISVSASTSSVSSLPSDPVHATTSEGIPTAPLNVSWKAATPKDVDLMWSRPRNINGNLLYYLVTYSHDLLEWKNHTVPSHLTSTQIQDLVSNTNYTVRIQGVSGKGGGTQATVYVYINATLVGEPQISTDLVVISVVILFAAITCILVAVLCIRMIRLRQSAAASFQGNGACRMTYANGLKPSSRDHGIELNDYKPMLTSLPPAMLDHHLDTKGGPGSHGDGVVVNCLLEANSPSMNQVDVPNENHVPAREGAVSTNLEDSLDDIDDDVDDASRMLLQTLSVRKPEECGVPSKDCDLRDPRQAGETAQVEFSSSSGDGGARVEEATALS